jgi:hypothetical protein
VGAAGSSLAKKRAREDDSYREENVEGDSLVPDDRWKAFAAFLDAMRREDQRLITERRAEVAELMRKYRRKDP